SNCFEIQRFGDHSCDDVRLNGVVSLMPEFSAAFGCKAGDREYSTEASSCYLFGPLSGVDRTNEKTESNHKKELIDDSSEIEGSGSGEEPSGSLSNDELLS
ncbi:hypothetical protein PMAYCL1PPCAC_24720, partial [Pristionchus mayeri]